MTNRHYGTGNKYGNGRLYGATNDIVLGRWQWAVDIGWNTTYSGDNEAIYMTDLYVFRGRRNFLNPNGQGFAPIETGIARVTLDNSDGRYDGWNTSSPLYPNVQPGKDIRIRVADLEGRTVKDVFTGVVVDIETQGYGADAKVVLACEDYWRYLRNQTVDYRTDVLTNLLIDEIIYIYIFNGTLYYPNSDYLWPYGFNLEQSTQFIPYWWPVGDVSMGDMLQDLAQSYFGKFFIAADGRATYYDRDSVRASVQTITQAKLLKDIGNYQPWTNQRNAMRVRVNARKQPAVDVIVWSLSEPEEVASGETLEIEAILTYNGETVPCNFLTTTAFTANTASDGSGTDITSGFITKYIPYGDRIIQRFVNNSGLDGYITALEWDGKPAYFSGQANVKYPRFPQPQLREFVIDSIWHQNIQYARNIVNRYGPQIATVRQFPVIKFDTRVEGLVPDLFDIETISIAKLGISNTAFEVGGIEIETTSETCQSFIVTHYLEPHFT